jgi:hypothetical protein
MPSLLFPRGGQHASVQLLSSKTSRYKVTVDTKNKRLKDRGTNKKPLNSSRQIGHARPGMAAKQFHSTTRIQARRAGPEQNRMATDHLWPIREIHIQLQQEERTRLVTGHTFLLGHTHATMESTK